MLAYFLSDALLIPIGGLFLQVPTFLGLTGSWKSFSLIKFFWDAVFSCRLYGSIADPASGFYLIQICIFFLDDLLVHQTPV